MAQESKIINRVANSSLITFDLEEFYEPGERVLIDIKDQLQDGLVLREKNFREYIKDTDWSSYTDKFVAISCSTDAIIPVWAFMLVAMAVQPYARKIVFGTLSQLEEQLFREKLEKIEWNDFKDSRVVVKGCSKVNVPEGIYVLAAAKLRSVATSVMFGEACSTVPLFKRPKSP